MRTRRWGYGLFWITGFAAVAAAETLEVSPKSKFPTIQAAVDAAGPGDRIEIGSGVYVESVTIPPGLDGLEIEGEEPAKEVWED